MPILTVEIPAPIYAEVLSYISGLMKPAAEPKPKPAAEPKPAAQPKPAAEPKPAAQPKPEPDSDYKARVLERANYLVANGHGDYVKEAIIKFGVTRVSLLPDDQFEDMFRYLEDADA